VQIFWEKQEFPSVNAYFFATDIENPGLMPGHHDSAP
jgi:hypothetical protein